MAFWKQAGGQHPSEELNKLSDAAHLRPHVIASLAAAVQAFRQDSPQHEVHTHVSHVIFHVHTAVLLA